LSSAETISSHHTSESPHERRTSAMVESSEVRGSRLRSPFSGLKKPKVPALLSIKSGRNPVYEQACPDNGPGSKPAGRRTSLSSGASSSKPAGRRTSISNVLASLTRRRSIDGGDLRHLCNSATCNSAVGNPADPSGSYPGSPMMVSASGMAQQQAIAAAKDASRRASSATALPRTSLDGGGGGTSGVRQQLQEMELRRQMFEMEARNSHLQADSI